MGLLVFTDLDGTLLDHHDYRFDAAKPALAALRARNVPVVLASSKTAAEIAPLHVELDLGDAPAIVENGAATIQPGTDASEDRSEYHALRQCLTDLPPQLRQAFRGFGDMSVADIVDVTGLEPAQASLARQRQFSEPGLWTGTEEERHDFEAALAEMGVTARSGGRFLALSFGGTKAQQMDGIIARFAPLRTIALGDAPNDVEMLKHADFGVIIRNDHGPGFPHLNAENTGQIRRTTACGPEGWNQAILDILKELDQQGDRD